MLRDDLREMERIGATPEVFGLKVRAHPDSLIVTARNKMRATEKVKVQLGFAGRLVETFRLLNSPEAFEQNLQAASRLARQLKDGGFEFGMRPEGNFGGHLLQFVPADHVIRFLQDFRNHPLALMSDPDLISKYIEANKATELGQWDVLFYGLQSSSDGRSFEILPGIEVICQRRDVKPDPNTKQAILVTMKNRVASRGVEKIGLTRQQIEDAESSYALEHPAKIEAADGKPNYPDFIYRRRRPRPLLIVHHLVFGASNTDVTNLEPHVAWSISFPGTITRDQTVEFVAGSVYLREFYGDLRIDDEDTNGDEAADD
jgi:hypothetical protein